MYNKKLMEQFLTAIKEASIDCIINYDKKDKCLSFSKFEPSVGLKYKENAKEEL